MTPRKPNYDVGWIIMVPEDNFLIVQSLSRAQDISIRYIYLILPSTVDRCKTGILIKNANVQTETIWIKIWMILKIQLTRNQRRPFPFWRCFWFCKFGHSKITIDSHQALFMLLPTGSMTLALLVWYHGTEILGTEILGNEILGTVPKSISQHNNSSLESCWIAHRSICWTVFQLRIILTFLPECLRSSEIMNLKTYRMA